MSKIANKRENKEIVSLNFDVIDGSSIIQKKRENEMGKQKKSSLKKEVMKFINNNIVSGVLIVIILYFFHDLPDNVSAIREELATHKAKIESLEGNYYTINSQIWSSREVADKEELGDKAEVLVASDNLLDIILTHYSSDNQIFASSGNVGNIKVGEVVGTSVKTQNEVKRESLVENGFITSYEQNGEKVYFYGKYNSNNRWDGYCIINRYKDSKLTFIMEANYDNGDLKDYRQVFKGKNLREQEIWYVADREISENSKRDGYTKTYFYYGDYEKDMNIENIQVEDILDVDTFCETIPSSVEGYYNGYVSNGKYNDETGESYLVKYDYLGNVRYLYVGNIKNGVPDDQTGKAWSIAWGYDDDGYYYYKGTFSKGNHGKPPKNWRPMTQEEIDEIVNPDDFACSLQRLIGETI